MTFKDLALSEDILAGLEAMNFRTPTPIQAQAIPPILAEKDLIACAQTGTGKTAAFLLPIIQRAIEKPHQGIDTLVVVPTRELAMQIDQQLEGFSYFVPVSSRAIYGGSDGQTWVKEKKALTQGSDIIIATPGKLISHLRQGIKSFDYLRHLILDEADRMLDMGFYEDIMEIISYLPKKRQNLLFSATMPPKIHQLGQSVLEAPEEIMIALSKPAEKVVQAAFFVYEKDKIDLVKYLFRDDDMNSVIIFCGTKKKVDQIYRTLKRVGLSVSAIHSGLVQKEREQVLNRFKGKQCKVLIATDIVSRGIDIDSIEMVINFDVPGDAEDYIHRVGRTARAENSGEAITFINRKDRYNFLDIEKLIDKEVRKVKLPTFLETPQFGGHLKPRTKKYRHKK